MKTKNLIKTTLSLTILFSSLAACFTHSQSINSVSATTDAPQFANYATEYNGYYSSINDSMTGGANGTLRTALTKLIKPNAYYSYSGDSVGELGHELQYYDEDPNNSNNMILFYTQRSITKCASEGAKNWNREHSWPQNNSGGLYGKSGAGADLLHIRPTYEFTNRKRSNLRYGPVSGSYQSYNGYEYGKVGSYFEPTDKVKGDCARITFYMWVCYFADRGTPITNNCNSVQTMLEWHRLDPVSEQEMMRNNRVAQSKQKNRNPFVDYPDWAEYIFGNGTVTPSIKMPTSLSLTVGKTSSLNATVSNGTGTISYSSNNTSVATVNSSGVVTALKQGNATITASVTISGKTYTATCAVTVSDPVTVSSVSLTGQTSITSGEKGKTTFNLTAKVNYSSGSGTNQVTYTATKHNSKDIVSISNTGVVTCLDNGTTTITATSVEDTTKKATLNVTISGLVEPQLPASGTATISSFSALSGAIDDVISYQTAQNSGTSVPQLNNGQIRLYQNSSGANGGSVTVYVNSEYVNDYRISKAVLKSAMATYVSHKVDGGTQTSKTSLAVNAEYKVDGIQAQKVEMICMGTSTSQRIYLNYLSVTYVNINTQETITATTLAEYILAENKEGQCVTRFYVARDMYLNDLSTTEQQTFKTSTDSSIVLARQRYEHWALHLGEKAYENAKASASSIFRNGIENISLINILILVSSLSLVGFILIKSLKKKNR